MTAETHLHQMLRYRLALVLVLGFDPIQDARQRPRNDDDDRRYPKADKGKLPSCSEGPCDADDEHRCEDGELADDGADKRPRVFRVLDERVRERACGVLGTVEERLVLPDHFRQSSSAERGRPSHRASLHAVELEEGPGTIDDGQCDDHYGRPRDQSLRVRVAEVADDRRDEGRKDRGTGSDHDGEAQAGGEE